MVDTKCGAVILCAVGRVEISGVTACNMVPDASGEDLGHTLRKRSKLINKKSPDGVWRIVSFQN